MVDLLADLKESLDHAAGESSSCSYMNQLIAAPLCPLLIVYFFDF